MDRSEQNTHGADRIREHPVLGEAPGATGATFTFDGAPVTGTLGEPIAAALLAAGVRVFRTTSRLDEARGGYCMVGRCADCLAVVDGLPNVRACMTPVGEGLDVRTQHGVDAADRDESGATGA